MLAIICLAVVIFQQVSSTPIPYKGFDLNKYTGKWLEVIATRMEFPNIPKLPIAYCTRQAVHKLSDGDLQLYSSARIGSVDGEKKEVKQTGKMTKPGVFDFQFKMMGVDISYQYRVVKVGPTNANGKYDYVIIVAEKSGLKSIWVGARDAHVFKSKHAASVKKYLKGIVDEKWHKTAKFISTYQGSDCR